MKEDESNEYSLFAFSWLYSIGIFLGVETGSYSLNRIRLRRCSRKRAFGVAVRGVIGVSTSIYFTMLIA